MTKTFTYTYKVIRLNEGAKKGSSSESDYHWEEITLKKRVTDRMEERNFHKAAYAAEHFTQVLRREYGKFYRPVLACQVKEI